MLNTCDAKPNTQFMVEDDHAIIAMVESGLGVSVLADLVLRRTPFRIVRRPLDPPLKRDIVLAHLPGHAPSVSTRKFIEHVKIWKQEGCEL